MSSSCICMHLLDFRATTPHSIQSPPQSLSATLSKQHLYLITCFCLTQKNEDHLIEFIPLLKSPSQLVVCILCRFAISFRCLQRCRANLRLHALSICSAMFINFKMLPFNVTNLLASLLLVVVKRQINSTFFHLKLTSIIQLQLCRAFQPAAITI